MFSSTNTALDLGVLERRLLHLHRILLLCLIRLPVDLWLEDDILGDAGGIRLWAGWLALLITEFRPVLALGDSGVDGCADGGLSYSAGGLDLLALVVDVVCDYGLGSIFVLGDGIFREGDGLLAFIVVGPVARRLGSVAGVSLREICNRRWGTYGSVDAMVVIIWVCIVLWWSLLDVAAIDIRFLSGGPCPIKATQNSDII